MGVMIASVANGRQLRLLHAIHDFLPRHRAGSEIYAAQLSGELASRHHVTVVCADYDPARIHGQLTWRLYERLPVIEIANNWVCAGFADTYRSPLMSARLEQVLDIVQPHILHVHNLLNLSFNLPAAARARGIPVVATLHDYTLVCPSGGQRIHRAESHVCRTIDPTRCARCFVQSPFHTQTAVSPVAATMARSSLLQRLATTARTRWPRLVRAAAATLSDVRSFSVTAEDISERLARAREVFNDVDVFVAPSRSIAEEFIGLGLDRSKVRVSDYGFASMSRPGVRASGGPLRIGFVGTLVWHKGAHVLLEAVRRLTPGTAYELRMHGDMNVFPDYVATLRRLAEGLPVQFRGGFDATRTSDVYAELDLLVVPSIWLENSPLVIHEAFQAGVPVVGARIGGVTDLIADGRNGRLYNPQSHDELAAILQSVIADRAQLTRWAAQLSPVKTIADDAHEWERVYADLLTPVAAAVSSPW